MSIIKCPECGQRVSTMAGTCPHCGVNIAGNLKQCPNCHTYCLNAQDKCPECNAYLSVITKENVTTSTIEVEKEGKKVVISKEKNENKEPVQKKGNHSPIIITFVICGILLITGAYFLNLQRLANQEEKEFVELENTTNPIFYQEFLNKYPDSKHYAEIEDRMRQLESENQLWNKLIASKSRIDVVQFMQKYPNSVRNSICENLLDSIDWNEAMTLNTEEAADFYLQNHPEGNYASEATILKESKERLKVTEQERNILHGIMDSFTNALSKKDIAQISGNIPQTMSNFNGSENIGAEQIVSYIDSKLSQDVIGIHFLISEPFVVTKEILPDETIGYVVNFVLEETISRSDTNQPNNKTYNVNAKLNAERKITYFNMK